MLAAGAYARPGVRQCLALDLGTSAVRLWTPSTGTVISEPAVIARRPDGRYTVGQAALDASAHHDATLIRPMRDGVVRDFHGCVHLLRRMLADLGQPYGSVCPVLVGVPATATLRQKNVLVAVVRRAVGERVVAVEEPLAAALACRPDPGHDDLVAVDMGFGRTEVARIVDRSVAAAERVEGEDPVDQISAIARCVRHMNVRGATGRRRLLITGGGAASPGAAARLAALTGRSVTMPAEPLLATLTGLRLLLTG
ncbi:rod shape-determining protein MreB [Micromonospora viridifaciens]|uniref:Rod shape-determining protein MreB n=1 Tax=Micromonospora viridifaciens TaxID=1881 RepID=A0A1C4XDN8_MICVI|nr:rod shape-determining protein [Micromonospora viridifaciens]SCF06442.1 rod shape-determining protein MreB [Micromonospora viridifaciens]